MTSNFPATFRHDTLRKHRRKILLEREKALLPAMQVFAEARKHLAEATKLYDASLAECMKKYDTHMILREDMEPLWDEYLPLLNKLEEDLVALTPEESARLNELKLKIAICREKENRYFKEEYYPSTKARDTIHSQVLRYQRMYLHGTDNEADGATTKENERRQFLMRCPSEGCRGFLSQSYKCGICSKHTCSDCLEVIGSEEGTTTLQALKAAHTCKTENIESAKMIKKETRACPKCGARIYKLDGCDQMWCTMEGCGTAFSWQTGHIVTGRVHNPHYYEWLRRMGGGQAPPRETGDIPCGGMPAAYSLVRLLGGGNVFHKVKDFDILMRIHRYVLDLEDRLRQFPAQPEARMNKDIDVDYLINAISEEEWQRKLEHAEARFLRKKEIGQILQTAITAAADVFQGIIARAETANENSDYKTKKLAVRDVGTWILETAFPTLESLRVYTNDAFKGLAKDMKMAVPQIAEHWRWVPIRILSKNNATKNEIVETTGLNPEEVEG
jgi:hypothetical protein